MKPRSNKKQEQSLTLGTSMNVLLTTSAAPDRSPFMTVEKRFPIGVGFLLAALEKAGHKTYFLDNYLSPTHFEETDYLSRNKIDVVGISSNTICSRHTLHMIRALDQLRQTGKWRGRIVVGGPHTSVAKSDWPDAVDHVVIGEADRTIIDVVEGKRTERIIRGERIEDLDSLPRPAYHHFMHLPYDKCVSEFRDKPVFTMNTSRGCPFGCSFCSVAGVWGRSYRTFSAERVVEDIEFLCRDYGARGIYFREDNFTFDHNRLTTFCELLIRKNVKIKWLCESRVKPMSREVLALMKRAGCSWMYFGCESGSIRMLELYNKGITPDDIRRTTAWCKELGIRDYTSWIVGAPYETTEDIAMTLDLIEEIKPWSVGLNVYVGLPGSELYEKCLKDQCYSSIDDIGLLYGERHDQLVQLLYPNAVAETASTPGSNGKLARRVPVTDRIISSARQSSILRTSFGLLGLLRLGHMMRRRQVLGRLRKAIL